MKELSVEEKAKRYDEAFEIARLELQERGNEPDGAPILSKLFPELKESEDERIRKELIEHCRNTRCVTEEGAKRIAKWIIWLERQGEQKLANSAKTCKGEQKPIIEIKSAEESLGIDSDTYNKIVDECIYGDADNVEPKFKVGDTMRTLQEATDGYTDGMPVVVSIDKEYYHCTNELIAIKDQDDYEYPPTNRSQKPAWSEEDINLLNRLIGVLDGTNKEDYHEAWEEKFLPWLKSLKDRYTWKPSDEQIKSLEEVINEGHFTSYPNALETLCEQLKKLKEE